VTADVIDGRVREAGVCESDGLMLDRPDRTAPAGSVLALLLAPSGRQSNGQLKLPDRPGAPPATVVLRTTVPARGVYTAEYSLCVIPDGAAVTAERGDGTVAYHIENKAGQLIMVDGTDLGLGEPGVRSLPPAAVRRDWVGRIVTLIGHGGSTVETGVLVATVPFELDLGWDKGRRDLVTPSLENVTLVKLETGRDAERAAKLLGQVSEALSDERFSDLDPDLHSRAARLVEDRRVAAPAFEHMSTVSLTGWIASASQLVGDLDRAQLAAAELRRQVDEGVILLDWGPRAQGSRAFVVRADGNLRLPDRRAIGVQGRPTRWQRVEADEAALAWEDGECCVDKLPVDGCTVEQLEAIASLESQLAKDLGRNQVSFGLDAPLRERDAARWTMVRQALLERVLKEIPDGLRFDAISREEGVSIAGTRQRDRSWDPRGPALYVNNRPSFVVEWSVVSDGQLEVLVVGNKQERTIRWRELSGTEPHLNPAQAAAVRAARAELSELVHEHARLLRPVAG
jgi:hypothetical protein